MSMTKHHSDPTVTALQKVADTITAIGKLILLSKPSKLGKSEGDTLIIMGNGPSLRQTIDNSIDTLKNTPALAVNFAANTPEFRSIRPRYYVLADPHFFNSGNAGVDRLIASLNSVDWPMTLFVPHGVAVPVNNPMITVRRFNMVGIDGIKKLRHAAYSRRLAMPRPRNVLIPSIMIGIWLGYKNIYIVGADHSWTRTLDVNERNEVISVQPHFYADDDKEKRRVNAEYLNYPLHQIIHSFYVAFRAYHDIEQYARTKGIAIYNATPESFIDAFARKPLP